MALRLLVPFLTVALAGAFAQFEFPGLFGKVTSRPRAGDLAPEISFAKVLHNEASAPWASGNLNGRVTVLMFLPYVSGNLETVNAWNALVERFARKPVQFAWITSENQEALLPFLKAHPIQGWVFDDPDKKTGQSYGLETPEPIIIGADGRIVGFDSGFVPSDEVIHAALANRVTTLSPEARRMPRPEDHRPDFAPSYAVHIAPAKDPANGGNFSAMDSWSLQSYTVKRVLAQMLEVNPIRIELPASIDASARYDFAVVLPKPEDKAAMRNLIRQGVEDYFHLVLVRENLRREVYVLTASGQKLPPADKDPFGGGGLFSSAGFIATDGADDLAAERPHGIDAMSDITMQGDVDEFCHMLENGLDRPVINETKLDGSFNFHVTDPGASLKGDFVERLRDQLGLVITPAQRNVEAFVYRQR